jgi:hypothetical protein
MKRLAHCRRGKKKGKEKDSKRKGKDERAEMKEMFSFSLCVTITPLLHV